MNFYNRLMTLARHDHAEWVLAAVSFADASFFPLPPHTLLVPLVLAQPSRAVRLALVCTIASVLGGFLGYGIGHVLYDTLGQWIIETYHYQAAFDRFRVMFQEWGAWLIVAKGVTPIPFKIVAIAAGVADFDLFSFTWSSIISRGGQFLIIAVLIARFGPTVEPLIERFFWQIGMGVVALVVIGFVALNYI
jgi:membrane protein YqaA with SNARE-associated domain